MKDSLLVLIVTAVVTVKCTADGEHSCIDRNDINCTTVVYEYDTERRRCQETFTPCLVKNAMCRVQEFCSDECRDIYHKVLGCMNDTDKLHYLNLYCALSSDPKHQNSSCIHLELTQKTYGYESNCQIEIGTQFARPCVPVCANKLSAYKNDCCAINVAIARGFAPGKNNEDLINLHEYRLWDHCGVESPEMCPAPSCPMTHMPDDTPIVPTAEECGTGAALTHHVNWFLFVTVPLVLPYTMI